MNLAGEEGTGRVGALLAAALQAGDVVTLSGPLGVGKTALARSILRAAGHQGEVPSPTFAIVQPYDDLSPPIWHCDLYRLDDPSEMEELGLDSALEDGALLIEWPERAGAAAWPQALCLSLDFAGGDNRSLTWVAPPAWEARWPPAA
jgi:tRNA threonylcarbamoyladenosine biosynthesis protein TsaE